MNADDLEITRERQRELEGEKESLRRASEPRTSYASCPEGSRRTTWRFPEVLHRGARSLKRQHAARLHAACLLRDEPPSEDVALQLDVSDGLSVGETALNVMNMTVGAGVMVLPFAVQNGGWIVLLVLSVYACWCWASHWMVGELLAQVDGEACAQGIPRENRGWNVLAEASLGPFGRKLIEVLMWLECYGIQCSYLILAGRSTHLLVPTIPTNVHILCLGLMMALMLFVPLKHFSALSFVGGLSYSMIWVAIVLTGIELGGMEHVRSQQRTFIVPSNIFTSMGMINYVYNGLVGSPAFYQAMKDRSAWPVAVSWAMVGIFAFSVPIAACSYAIFGAATQQSILENVGRGMNLAILEEPLSRETNSYMAQTCAAMLALKLIVGLPSYGLPVVSSLEYHADVQGQSSVQVCVRVLYAALTAVITAALHDNLATVMSLVGCITNNALSFLLPPAMYLILKWDSLSMIGRAGLSALVAISLGSMGAGVCSVLKDVLSAG